MDWGNRLTESQIDNDILFTKMSGEVAKGIWEACRWKALQKRKLNKKTIDVDIISHTQIKGCTTSEPHLISGGTKKLDRGQNQTFISVSVRSMANLKKK